MEREREGGRGRESGRESKGEGQGLERGEVYEGDEVKGRERLGNWKGRKRRGKRDGKSGAAG